MAYKKTDWLDDQILVTGFAAGGLTEVPQEQFRTCSMAVTLATELGPFGIKTQVRRVTGACWQRGSQEQLWTWTCSIQVTAAVDLGPFGIKLKMDKSCNLATPPGQAPRQPQRLLQRVAQRGLAA